MAPSAPPPQPSASLVPVAYLSRCGLHGVSPSRVLVVRLCRCGPRGVSASCVSSVSLSPVWLAGAREQLGAETAPAGALPESVRQSLGEICSVF